MLISELLRRLEEFAPLSLALEWDNVGLLLGDPGREVNKALVSLDVTPNALRKALESGANLILSHHPLIFRPLQKITDPLLLSLIENRISVISLHTNLDVAPGGVNHALAGALGLEVIGHLTTEQGGKWHHVSVAVPPQYTNAVVEAVFQAGGGRIGNYSSCSTRHEVSGTFKAGEAAKPFIGRAGESEINRVEEEELEFMVGETNLAEVLAAIRASHPYETPLLYHFPVADPDPAYGLGLVGKFPSPLSLLEIAQLVSARLHCPHPRLWTAGLDPKAKVGSVAVCGGAGTSILKSAERQADLVVTGDIGYHQLLESRIPIIDAGHFYTEYPVLEVLKDKLAGWDVAVKVLPMAEHEFFQNSRKG